MKYENPYLIEFLKMGIEFDTMQKHNTKKVTITQITDYILNRQETYYSKSGTIYKAAGTFSENVRKAWSKKDFEYEVQFLDMLATASDLLGKFSCWNEFTLVHGSHLNARTAEKFRDKLFTQLPGSTQHDIMLDVLKNIRLIRNARKKSTTSERGHNSSTEGNFAKDYINSSTENRAYLNKFQKWINNLKK